MIKSFSKAVLEAGFDRVHQHTRNRNIGMILASRDELTSEENRQRHAALKSNVTKAGYGYIEGHHVDVKSLLVVGKSSDDGGYSARTSEHLGKKYGQESILYKPHNSEKASLHRTNETEKHKHIEVGSWHPNRTGEFYSLMKSREADYGGGTISLHHRKIVLFANGKIVLAASAILEEHARTFKSANIDFMTSCIARIQPMLAL
jgi:hypothetical protein